MESEANIKKT
jgi:hypothetical protein